METRLTYSQGVNDYDASWNTAVHHALLGRHDSMLMQTENHAGRLIGGHEAIIADLVAHSDFDAALNCPIYIAIHLMSLPAVRILMPSSG